ncbi:MAG TPA: hypothetical protein VLI05_02445 [Candidatus Saccharimonadia bacterium]|nr:hypothetical protein [Candidatus Saccharimonadia bacterium]
MLTLLRKGDYRLIETKGQVKILYLDDDVYAWVHAQDIGELLIASHVPHRADYHLASGRYRLYEAESEARFASQQHLELLVGKRHWQGYLLPAGLPDGSQLRVRLIPTLECITLPQVV